MEIAALLVFVQIEETEFCFKFICEESSNFVARLKSTKEYDQNFEMNLSIWQQLSWLSLHDLYKITW